MNLAARRGYAESALAAVVMAVAVGGVWAELHYAPSQTPSPAGAYALTFGAAAPLLLLRRRPVLAAAICVALCYLYRALGYPGFAPAMLIFVACYVLANSRGLVYGLGPAVAGWIIPALPPNGISLWNSAVAMPAVGMALIALIGEANRRRRLDYEARVRESAATAEARLGLRMAEERLRIARELHDVLAHTISVVAVQSSVALDALDDSPEQARAAMFAVRGAAKQALPELRAALETLRGERETTEDGASPRPVPQPGLTELADLVRQAREGGLKVELDLGTDLDDATPLLQLTAYRIVQESLTNVRKHAAAARTRVAVYRENDLLTVDVLDDGAGARAQQSSPVPGFGLRGMRERAASLGGDLEAGPRPEGGFAVRARLPWSAATDAAAPPAPNGAE